MTRAPSQAVAETYEPTIGLWGSALTDDRRRRLRRYLRTVHLVAGIPVLAVTAVLASERSALFAVTALYIVGIVLAAFLVKPSDQVLAFGLVDAATTTAGLIAFPDAWPVAVATMLTLVSMGWGESVRVTLMILTVATGGLAIGGLSAGIDRWWFASSVVFVLGVSMSVTGMYTIRAKGAVVHQLAEALNTVRLVAWRTDDADRVVQVTGHVQQLFELEPSEAIGMSLTDFAAGDAASEWLDVRRRVMEPGANAPTVSVVHRVAGSERVVRTSVRAVQDDNGRRSLSGITTDIDDDWRRARTERIVSSIASNMIDGMVLFERAAPWRLLWSNSAFDEVAGSVGRDALFAEIEPHVEAIWLDDSVDAQHVERYFDDRWFAFHLFQTDDRFVTVQVSDITRRKRIEQEIAFAATHDSLTGLIARGEFHRRLEEAIDTGCSPVVGLLDVDQFKAINDAHGHHAGDEVLRRLARRLTAALPENGCAGRLGGDELGILIPASLGVEEVDRLGYEIDLALSRPLEVDDGVVITPSVSIGFARLDEVRHPDGAMRLADERMYTSKKASREGATRLRSASR